MWNAIKKQLTKTWLNPTHLARILVLKLILEARVYASGLLLDIGCGKKPYLSLYSVNYGEYVGMDMRSDSSHIPDVLGDALNIPLKSGVVDTVLCTQVLEHLPDPNRCIEEIYRVLKQNGYLILTAPQTGCLHEEPYDFFRFTKYGLRILTEKHGFNVEYIKPDCGSWAVIGETTNEHICSIGKAAYPIGSIIQLLFYWLDALCSHRGKDTLNYIIVAKKT